MPQNGFFDQGVNGSPPPPALESCLYGPWGHEYGIVMDTTGDDRIDLSGIYLDFANAPPLKSVGVFSVGKDGALGTNGDRIYRKGDLRADDTISWE